MGESPATTHRTAAGRLHASWGWRPRPGELGERGRPGHNVLNGGEFLQRGCDLSMTYVKGGEGGRGVGSGAAPDADVLHLLDLIYATYRRTGRWPTMTEMGYTLIKEGRDVEVAVETVPEALLNRPLTYGHQGRTTLSMTVAGISEIDQGRRDLETLARAIHVCWEFVQAVGSEAASEDGNISITSEQMAERLPEAENDPTTVWLLGRLLMNLGGISQAGSFGAGPGAPWQVTLDLWELLRRRHITTADDFLDFHAKEETRRQGLAATVPWRPPPATWPSGAPSQVEGTGELEALVEGWYVFVLMPFKERAAWSDDVYGWMVKCFRELVDEYPGLHWRRADELRAPGLIPNQVREEIARAGIIVADLTGSNENVFYELGYCHGLRKVAILLNQDPQASPFDLRVDRQMRYDLGNPHAFVTTLKGHLREVLGPAAPPLEVAETTIGGA